MRHAKLIHLPEKVIEILTIRSIKLKKTFKVYVQELLEKEANKKNG